MERHRHKSTTASRVPPGLTTLQQKAWIKSQKKLSLACAAVAKMEDDAEIQPEPELEAQHAAVSSGVELQRQAIETGLTFGDVRGKSDGEIRAFMRALKIDTRPSTSSPELQQEPRVLEVKPRSQAREETVKARSATSAAASVPVEVSETGSLLQTLQREVDKLALELMATVKRQMLDTEAKLGANMVTQLAILKADLANDISKKVPEPELELEAQHAAASSSAELQREAIENGLNLGGVRLSDGETRALMRALKIDTSTSLPELQQEPRVLEVKPHSQAREETVKARSATSAAASVPVEVSETGSLVQTLQREIDKLAKVQAAATIDQGQLVQTVTRLESAILGSDESLGAVRDELAGIESTVRDIVSVQLPELRGSTQVLRKKYLEPAGESEADSLLQQLKQMAEQLSDPAGQGQLMQQRLSSVETSLSALETVVGGVDRVARLEMAAKLAETEAEAGQQKAAQLLTDQEQTATIVALGEQVAKVASEQQQLKQDFSKLVKVQAETMAAQSQLVKSVADLRGQVPTFQAEAIEDKFAQKSNLQVRRLEAASADTDSQVQQIGLTVDSVAGQMEPKIANADGPVAAKYPVPTTHGLSSTAGHDHDQASRAEAQLLVSKTPESQPQSQARAEGESCSMHVRGIKSSREDELAALFGKFGECVSVVVRRRYEAGGEDTSWALITMANMQAADAALTATVVVSLAFPGSTLVHS